MLGRTDLDWARMLLLISCATGAVAVVTLVAFFWLGQPGGTCNDLSYGVFAILLLPLPSYLRRIFGPKESTLARLTFNAGWVWFAGLAGASFLLTSTELGLLSLPSGLLGPLALQGVFFLMFEIWLLMLGSALRQGGLANSLGMSLLAVTLVGYPVWAIWLAGKVATRAGRRQPAGS